MTADTAAGVRPWRACAAHVLAVELTVAAEAQKSSDLAGWFAAVAAALAVEAGEDPATPPPIHMQRVAAAMLDTRHRVAVEPGEADLLTSVLQPVAAWWRTQSHETAPVFARVISEAVVRLGAASAWARPAPTDDDIVDELELHESECVADAVLPGARVQRCPCGGVVAVRCGKCHMVVRTLLKAAPCSHVEQLAVGDLDDWHAVESA